MGKSNCQLQERRILICLTGGIACYKVAALVSQLVQSGAIVDVVMTEAATRFVTPLTFASLTGRAVQDSLWSYVEKYDPQHIRLAKSAEVVLVAPCTMNMLGKLSVGLTNDPVSLVVSAVDRKVTPVLLAPSMNETMFHQPTTQRNIEQLKTDGFTILDAPSGWQACRTDGKGRLPEPETLIDAIEAGIRHKNSISS